MSHCVLSVRRLYWRDIRVSNISVRYSQTTCFTRRICKTFLFPLSVADPALLPVNTANPYYRNRFVRTAECASRAPPRARPPRMDGSERGSSIIRCALTKPADTKSV